jgi:hypothetical protein
LPNYTTISWQAVPYPPFWQGAGLNLGGQQVSPDCQFLFVWQTGAQTGGAGRVAVYSVASNSWMTGTFDGVAEPISWSIPVVQSGGGYLCLFVDNVTGKLAFVGIGGAASMATTAQSVRGVGLVNNGPINASSGNLITLAKQPQNVLLAYGVALIVNDNGLMNVSSPYDYRDIFLCGDLALSSESVISSTVPGTIGGSGGNPSQRFFPMRLYYNDTGRPALYADDVYGVQFLRILDAASWQDGGHYFPASIYRYAANDLPGFPASPICVKPNTIFEQSMIDLSLANAGNPGTPYINFDKTSFSQPLTNGGGLQGVLHVPFNLARSALGIPIEIATPTDFTSVNWSIWAMNGTTYILDETGHFYRLSIVEIGYDFYNVTNWRRLINMGYAS